MAQRYALLRIVLDGKEMRVDEELVGGGGFGRAGGCEGADWVEARRR